MPATPRPRILIAEDYPIFALGLRQVLKSEGELLGVIDDGDAVAAACVRQGPAVLLLDLSLPGLSGIALLRAVHQAAPEVRIVVLSSVPDEALAASCLEEGAMGFVTRSIEPRELLTAVREVLNGGIVKVLSQPQYVVERKQLRNRAVSRLTPRLREVLALIGRGLTSPQVAVLLGISPRTSEHHRGELYKRLGIANASALYYLAVEYAGSLEGESHSLRES